MKPEYHNGEVWARAESQRKAARTINVYLEAQPERSLGQIAHDAAVQAFGGVGIRPWSYVGNLEQEAWHAAAAAVRRAVGR